MYLSRNDLHRDFIRQMEEKQEGVTSDSQLGEKNGTRQAREKGTEMKEGKASMKERPLFQAGQRLKGFRCQSGLTS